MSVENLMHPPKKCCCECCNCQPKTYGPLPKSENNHELLKRLCVMIAEVMETGEKQTLQTVSPQTTDILEDAAKAIGNSYTHFDSCDTETAKYNEGLQDAAKIIRNLIPHPESAAPQQAIHGGMPRLNAEELALLHRFKETTEDDSSYDLSAKEIQKLAKLGAVRHNGGGHYSITEFGQWLSAAPQPESEGK